MSITRAQQARQMYKKGTKKPAIQGGGPNYLGKQPEVTVPKKWKSSPDHPNTELAYITEPEKQVLIALNMHGGLEDGKPNKGPKGVMSLQGDMGSIGSGGSKSGNNNNNNNNNDGGSTARERYITDYVSKQKVKGGGKKKPGTTGKDPSDYDDLDFRDPKNKEIIDRQKRNYEKQFFDKGKVPPLGSRPTSLKTKLDRRNLQKRLDYINYVQQQIRDKINKGLIDYQEEEGQIQGLTDFDTLESYIDKVQSVDDLVKEGFYSKDGRFAKGDIPDFSTKTGIPTADILGEIFGGPITSDRLNQLNEQFKTLEGLKTSTGLENTSVKDLMEEYQPNRFKLENPPTGGGRDDTPTDPCKGPNPPAYCFVNQDPTTPPDPTPDRNLGGLAPRFAGSIFDFTGMADGGRIGAAEGGIMDLETGRQMYFLGKLVKKASRAVKKIAGSKLGKAAILGGLAYFGGAGGGGFTNLLKKGFLKDTAGKFALDNLSPLKTIGIVSALSGLMAGKEEEEQITDRGPELTMEELIAIRNNPFGTTAPRFEGSRFAFAADGGRIGYQEGSKEPVAKETMPLLDMGGKEMDLRDDGGFVPIGRMEKADDVPARLSKNEFVFTAEAVRNAGDGDVDKGSEVMYNMMKNLESGGEVSEESQGLEGARKMFQTSKRLEEVI